MENNIVTLVTTGIILLSSCSRSPEIGVSRELAALRKQNISQVEYVLYLSIPGLKDSPVPSRTEISFEVKEKQKVALDFRFSDSCLVSITVNSRVYSTKPKNGHIIIPSKYIYRGINKVDIDFYAGESSLNRKDDFLYTLLVPDRASTVFPCFDQPDIKAQFTLSLEVPKGWVAVSNSPAENIMDTDTSRFYMFAPTKPISTYLFAFAAGKFDTLSRTSGSKKITMYYRENDTKKVERNRDAIFNSHFHSLEWLENYTGIPYPFDKLDIVLIPDFQYSGMEHPGSIFYRDSRLFLDENPSENQLLNQANLVAHEVSHQWFGNLVTMQWFNDVWMKEVFAGLMADKIVNPQYPSINHELSFLLSHYPRAYSVDRTSGSNPIRQNLDNLLLAGTLYGDIIYHKAPIAMMQLENTLGSELFQRGIQEYLDTYRFGNADWNNLVAILDSLTPLNLKAWSHAWINNATMPTVKAAVYLDGNSIKHYTLSQNSGDKMLPMVYSVENICKNGKNIAALVNQEKQKVIVGEFTHQPFCKGIQPNANGMGYGMFIPDSFSIKTLTDTSLTIENPVARASNYLTINELFLNGKLSTKDYFDFLISALNKEGESQIRTYLLGNIEMAWWQYMQQNDRIKKSVKLEQTLVKLFNSKLISVDERKPIFQTYSRIALSHKSIDYLLHTWEGNENLNGIRLSEQDYTNLAYELAVRNIHNADSILQVQESRITQPDRLSKFRFMKRAVSSDEATRDDFFHSLLTPANRRPEPWVTEALHYFNHPLRSAFSINYLNASLDLLPEIQQTGDIFFPKMWLDATLWGYNSPQAAKIVSDWLTGNRNVSESLKNKLRQSADLLFRANKNRE